MSPSLSNDLLDIALRHTRGRTTETMIPRVSLSRAETTTGPSPGMYQPMVCLVLQGAKHVTICDRSLHYDAASYFIASVDVPATGRISAASPEFPYVAVSLVFDPAMIASLILDLPGLPASTEACAGFAVSPVTPAILDPWRRMLKLLDTPEDVPALAPLYEREILYRLLQGPQGGLLRQIAGLDSRASQIRQAIEAIRRDYDQPLRIEVIADQVGMSASSFHRHFKAVTAMSPLQYQKSIRLQLARRLLLANPGDTAKAAYAVGYESVSQFTREYSRLFGAPPVRDTTRLKGTRAEAAVFRTEAPTA